MAVTNLNWLVVFILSSCVSQHGVQGSTLSVSVYSVTTKSIIVRWSRHDGASSYKVTATPKNTAGPSTFAHFSENTVMGSLNGLTPFTLYTVKVEAMDADRNVLNQGQMESNTAPDIPTIDVATSKQSDSITVEFETVSGAATYVLQAETADRTFFTERSVSSSPDTIQDLQPYTEYSVSVLAVNSLGGQSQPSKPVLVRTVLPAPQFNTSSSSNDTIQLDVEPLEHAVLYSFIVILQRSDRQQRLNTTSTSSTLTDLEPGSTYCTTAYAWDAEGRPGDRATVCQITRPAQPQGFLLSVVWDEQASLLVSWNASQEATEHVAVTSSGLSCSSSSSTCSISLLSCGETFFVTLTASNQAGPSLSSEPVEFISIPCSPNPVWLSEPEPGNCSVTWDAVATADFYDTFVKRDDGVEQKCNSTETSCNYSCLCGYTYIVSVFAYNQAGSSPPGPALNYTTLPCCPADVSISLVSTETLEIMWSPVRGAVLYETRAVDQSELIVCNDTSPVCALSDLSCNSRYNVVVIPCSELSGCNRNCQPQTHETAPCMPAIQNVSQTDGTGVTVTWTSDNGAANYTASLIGETDTFSCQSTGMSCEVTELSCGSTYDVTVVATTSAGASLPSYVVPLETVPCCPVNLTVDQVTQAMTNVSWSAARGAQTFVTSLTSPRGHARCHTQDTHCLMGCITCGTSYNVSVEVLSRTGRKAECSYQGFSSSVCCPSGVRLYSMPNNTLRVFWRLSGSLSNYTVDVQGSSGNYTCSPPPGGNYCDLTDVTCGSVYTVVVVPVNMDGSTVSFCPHRLYSGTVYKMA
ncbi:fibronectin type III domain-containing protein 7-like [Clupea harengus]|uniref:Fibronectin type III domain-containing protein 7-like n=1 Tax=Clupea harengus TaxID=7950 RepID=A0A8M1KM20_CLUHA|nr:fibronectin type III domain-containing protein 7-like [Clupea harengus]